MTQSRGDGLASNLSVMTKSASTDSGSKSHEHVGVLFFKRSSEERVEVEPLAPTCPILPIGGSSGTVHRGKGNFVPRRVEITRELISPVGVATCHNGICLNSERENTALKEVRKCKSE